MEGVGLSHTEAIALTWSKHVQSAVAEIKRIDCTDWPEAEKMRQKRIIFEHHAEQWALHGWVMVERVYQQNRHSRIDFSRETQLEMRPRL